MTTTTRFPDLSRARALGEDTPRVVLDGLTVVFDEKVALYPVRLEHKEPAAERRDERPTP